MNRAAQVVVLLSTLAACGGPSPNAFESRGAKSNLDVAPAPAPSSASAQEECRAVFGLAHQETQRQPTMPRCIAAYVTASRMCGRARRASGDFSTAMAKHSENDDIVVRAVQAYCREKALPRATTPQAPAPQNRIGPPGSPAPAPQMPPVDIMEI
jgi:hypothetical protein